MAFAINDRARRGMQRDILRAELGRLQATRGAMCAVIEGAQREMRGALDALADNPEVFVACAQLERDGRMLENMKQALVREIDAQVMVVQRLSADADEPPAYDSDAEGEQEFPRWLRQPTAMHELPDSLREWAVDPALSDANTARRAQVADDRLYAAEVAGEEDVRKPCGWCGENADVLFPCSHGCCFECLTQMLAAAPIVNGVKHVQCPCGIVLSDESDIRALDNAHACMHAEHAMLTMQRLLLKL